MRKSLICFSHISKISLFSDARSSNNSFDVFFFHFFFDELLIDERFKQKDQYGKRTGKGKRGVEERG